MYFFSHLSSFSTHLFLAPFQNPPMVTSFAAVTNLRTVISLLAATSSCPSRNSHICLTRGGAFSLVLSVAFSSLGVRNGVRNIPANSSSSGSQGISDFSASTRVSIWFNSSPGSEYTRFPAKTTWKTFPRNPNPPR